MASVFPLYPACSPQQPWSENHFDVDQDGSMSLEPSWKVRSAPAIVVSGPAQRSLSLWPVRSRSRLATLSIESSDSFVASTAVSIATGWSEPFPGRELHPLKSSAFSRRTFSPTSGVLLVPTQVRWTYPSSPSGLLSQASLLTPSISLCLLGN